MKIYEERLAGKQRFRLTNNTEVSAAAATAAGVRLDLKEVNTAERTSVELDAVVLATGFLDLSDGPLGEGCPPLLTPFAGQMRVDAGTGVLQVARDYQVNFDDPCAPALFLNGLCEASHGFGDAGSFSLLSIRSETIASALTSVMSRSLRHVQVQENLQAVA